jgi:DNA gyrase/topoisomerase IV subunit A
LENGEKIISAFIYNEDNILILASKNNLIKRTLHSSLSVLKSNSLSTIMGLEENDELVSCISFSKDELENKNKLLGTITETGCVLLYPIESISIVGKNASGVRNLNTSESIVSVFVDEPNNDFLVTLSTQGAKKIAREKLPIGKRCGKPKLIFSTSNIKIS